MTVQFTSGKYIFWRVKPHHASNPTSKYNQASGSPVVKNVSALRVHLLVSLRLPAQILKRIIYGQQSRKVDFGRAVLQFCSVVGILFINLLSYAKSICSRPFKQRGSDYCSAGYVHLVLLMCDRTICWVHSVCGAEHFFSA